MTDSKRQIKVGAAISYVALAVNITASLVYLPWMVSMIGRSNYALYTLASSFIALFMLDFGLSASVARFIAKYNAEGKEEQINEVVSTIGRLYVVIDLVIIAVLGILYFFIGGIYVGLTNAEIALFKQLYVIVAIYSVVSFPFLPLGGILNAFELFIQQKTIELLNKLLSVALVVCALLWGGDVRTLVIMNAVSGVATICVKLFIVRRKTCVSFRIGGFNRKVFLDVAQFSVWVTVMSLAQRCIFNLAPSILGIVSNSDEIALFAPANALEGYFYSVSAAVNGLFLATVSRYVASKENEKINLLMIRVGRYQFMVMGLVFIEFLCIGQDFMAQWMGEDFVGAWPCALLLFMPDILIFSEQIANTTVIAKNRVKEQAVGYIIMAASCVALSFPMSSALGAFGACIAISVGYTVLFAYMNILYYKKLQIDVFAFYKECYAKLIWPMLIVAGLGYYLAMHVIRISGWSGLAVKAGVIFVLFAVIMVWFLTESERDMVRRLVFRKKRI